MLSGCPSISLHILNISSLDSGLPAIIFAPITPPTIQAALLPSPLDTGMSLFIVISIPGTGYFKISRVFLNEVYTRLESF